MKEIVELLIQNKKTISTMESCTGGYIANAITNIEGSSEVIKFSAITYSNEFKIKFGISKDTIDEYSVYSKEVSNEMSKKISEYTNSDYGVGVTGKLNRIDPQNPYGNNNSVFISIYDKQKNTFYNETVTCTKSQREENKFLVLNKVVEMLSKIL